MDIFNLDSPISKEQFDRIVDYRLGSTATPTEASFEAGPSRDHPSHFHHGDGPLPMDAPVIDLTLVDDPAEPVVSEENLASGSWPRADPAEISDDLSGELAGLGDPSDLLKLCVTKEDACDLATCQNLVNMMVHLQTVMGEETEIIRAESWNFDTAVELIKVAQVLGRIPFGGGTSNLFDVEPTLNSERNERDVKGKSWQSDSKRTIFNLHPKDSMDMWLGKIPSKWFFCRSHFST